MNISKRVFAAIAITCYLLPGFGTPQTSAAEPPLIYGFMSKSDEWLDDGSEAWSHYGFYSFKTDGSTSFNPVSSISADNEWALNAGVYANGKYYCYNVDPNGSWLHYTLTFNVLNTVDWSLESSKSFNYSYSDASSEESQKAVLIPSDMAYNSTDGVVYAVARRYHSDQDSYLCSVNTSTGELTRIGAVPVMAVLTCSPSGVLYGVAFDGKLYTISTTDGEATPIGDTGFFPSTDIHQSATTDYSDGSIYWSMYGFASSDDRNYNRNGVFAMLRVNPETGAAEITWNYPRDQVFTAISIMVSNTDSPADVNDLTFIPQEFASSNGVVTFTAPDKTTVNKPITNDLTVKIYLDANEYATITATPGTTVSHVIEGISNGEHIASVEVLNGDNRSNRVSASSYFGFDIPAKVKDLTLQCDESKLVATVSWTAPTTGKNGAPYPADKIRYRVERYPGGEIIKRSLRETSFTDNVPHEYAQTYYVVTPYNVDKPSELGSPAGTNRLMMGSDISIPYSQAFDTSTDFKTFTTIDANQDGGDGEWGAPIWCYDDQYACAFYYGNRNITADDWLVTPPLKLDRNRLYRLTFQWYGYYGYGNRFKVMIGNEPLAENMQRELMDVAKTSYSTDNPGIKEQVVFSVREGDRFLAFHNICETMEHLSIDNIYIEDFGDARVPEAVDNLTATRLSDTSLSLSFNAPSTNAAGEPLTENLVIKIYKEIDKEPIATFSDIKPGAAINWTDETAATAQNDYIVLATNSFGNGLQSTVSLDLTPAVPQSITKSAVRYINDRQIEITWDPVTATTGDNGNPVNPDDIRYLAYRIVPTESGTPDYKLISRDIDKCRIVDDNPLYGYNSDAQQYIQYYLAPVNDAGEAIAALTPGVLVGNTLKLPFSETWLNGGSETTSPWLRNTDGASWFPAFQGYDPYTKAQDGYGLLSLETGYGVEAGYGMRYTPRIDFTTIKNPKLSIYLYKADTYPENCWFALAIDVEGKSAPEYLTGAIPVKDANTGWSKLEIDLTKYADVKRGSIILIGYTVVNNRLHVDNFRIEGTAEDFGSVRPLHITGNAEPTQQHPETYTVTVANLTADNATNVKIELKAGDTSVGNATIASIAAGATATAELAYTPAATAQGTVILSATVTGTGFKADNSAATKELTVRKSAPALINDLEGNNTPQGVNLTWNSPTTTEFPAIVNDGFENYKPFAIDNVGSWTLRDEDGLTPFPFQNNNGVIEWPNYQNPQAFIVFNPSEVDNTVPDFICPNDGNQFLMAVGSPYGANNDWLISPELSGDRQLISFYAKAMTSEDKESFHMLASTSDTNIGSFTSITGTQGKSLSADWELYHFVLPQGTKYFAINYTCAQKSGILIDDVLLCGYHTAILPDGYNIYRNGTKLNSTPVTSTGYNDASAKEGENYTYTVRPVYGNAEGVDSNAFMTLFSGINGIATDGCDITVTSARGTITVSGAQGRFIEIYTIDGRTAACLNATSDCEEIELAAGIYVVKVGNKVFKVSVK